MHEQSDTDLAAALFFLLGEQIPHDTKLEAQASALKKQFSDTKQAILKVVELCGEPHTAQQFYLCAKAYSWLGRQYDSMTVKFADSYLSSSGWDALPSGIKTADGVTIDLFNRNRAGVLMDLGGAYAGLEDYEKACSSYLQAYELEPYHVMYAIEAANALIRLGRVAEARNLLLLQKRSPYYKPTKYRDELGNVKYNYFFRESLDRQIERVNRLIKNQSEKDQLH